MVHFSHPGWTDPTSLLYSTALSFRCGVLVDAVTETVFNYVRRGLFERDKLTVATMLTLKILVNDGLLAQEEVDYLVMSKVKTLDGGYRLPCHVQGRHGGDRSSGGLNGHPVSVCNTFVLGI